MDLQFHRDTVHHGGEDTTAGMEDAAMGARGGLISSQAHSRSREWTGSGAWLPRLKPFPVTHFP